MYIWKKKSENFPKKIFDNFFSLFYEKTALDRTPQYRRKRVIGGVPVLLIWLTPQIFRPSNGSELDLEGLIVGLPGNA